MHNALTALQNLDPIAFSVGPFSVYWYGIAYALAFALAFWLITVFIKRWELSIDLDQLLTFLIGCLLGVVLGGRLGYVLFYGNGYYFAHPGEILAFWDGGMSFHGGLIGIFIGGAIAAWRTHIPVLTLADLASIGAPIGFGLGRIANFINGELWGRTTTSSWGIVFAGAGSTPRIPTQLIEALLEGLVLFIIVLLLALKRPPVKRGTIFGTLLTCYGAFRIFVEFFREPDAQLGYLAGNWLTMGMILSVPMVIVGVSLVIHALTRGAPQAPALAATSRPKKAAKSAH